MKKVKVMVLIVVVFALTIVSVSSLCAEERRTYYYAAGLHSHPYFLDTHLGFRYAAEHYNVNIIKVGPDGWDAKLQAEALEQAVAKKPDGIVTIMWDASGKPAVKRAMDNGIPVVVIDATVPDSGALTYVGLDNYDSGLETAQELIKRGGKSGKVAILGNWAAGNTQSKLAGFKEYLAENSDWKVVVEVEDDANTEKAIEAAKSVFNNHPDVNGIVGLDSSSGSGVAIAMEELNIDPKNLTVVVHDREDMVLDFIDQGYIDATMVNKTATSAFYAITVLELYNDAKNGMKNIPNTSDNQTAGVNNFPKYMYNGQLVIDKENVKYFFKKGMPKIKSKLYK